MTTATAVSGPVRFARFALPPHQLGYCGGTGDTPLSNYAMGAEDPGLRELAQTFEGAFPYLQLLAGSNGLADPLAAEVVEAYWIGNDLLDRVTVHDFGRSIDDRFRRRAGADWRHISDGVVGGVPNHAFHVLGVMPWAGLLRDGVVAEPLGIIDHCRISWALVTGFVDDDDPFSAVLVRRTPLTWSGSRLQYGLPVVETVRSTVAVDVGDVVAVHWDWICERLDAQQLVRLRAITDQQIARLRAS